MQKQSVRRVLRELEQKEPRTCRELVDAIYKLLSRSLKAWARTEKAAGAPYVSARLRKAHLLRSLKVRTQEEKAQFEQELRKLYLKLRRENENAGVSSQAQITTLIRRKA